MISIGSQTHSRKRGFSLIEMLVVAGIVGLSISVFLPVLLQARSAAQNQLYI